MIDPISVEEIGVAPCPLPQPVEIAFGEHVPPVGRKSPVLAGGAERVRRHTHRQRRIELVLSRPDVRAVAADHERQVTEQRHTARSAACRGPLLSGKPLHVLAVAHFFVELDSRVGERLRQSVTNRLRPLRPGALAMDAHAARETARSRRATRPARPRRPGTGPRVECRASTPSPENARTRDAAPST